MSRNVKIRQAAQTLNPIDDIMFKKLAESLPFCQEMLRVCLNDPDITVLENNVQYEITNLQGRSVRLDLKCVLGTGGYAAVEVQKADDDNHQKRVRYNTSLLTANITNPGVKFEAIPNVISLYISKSDIFNKGRTVYHVKRVIEETGDSLDNGLEEIYINANVDDGSDIAELMRVFTESSVYSSRFPEISARKRIFKETQEGVNIMSEELRKIFEKEIAEARAEGKAEARAEGKAEGKAEGEIIGMRNSLAQLVKDGLLNIAEAAKRTGLSIEEFKNIVAML